MPEGRGHQSPHARRRDGRVANLTFNAFCKRLHHAAEAALRDHPDFLDRIADSWPSRESDLLEAWHLLGPDARRALELLEAAALERAETIRTEGSGPEAPASARKRHQKMAKARRLGRNVVRTAGRLLTELDALSQTLSVVIEPPHAALLDLHDKAHPPLERTRKKPEPVPEDSLQTRPYYWVWEQITEQPGSPPSELPRALRVILRALPLLVGRANRLTRFTPLKRSPAKPGRRLRPCYSEAVLQLPKLLQRRPGISKNRAMKYTAFLLFAAGIRTTRSAKELWAKRSALERGGIQRPT